MSWRLWDDQRFSACDFETSGKLPEYALQPWRYARGDAWLTNFSTVEKSGSKTLVGGGLNPTRGMLREYLTRMLDERRTVVAWNALFEIMWFTAMGCEDLVKRVSWIDGMLLWRHTFIEPEYDENIHSRKSYGLKACVEEYLPKYAGYAEDVDFHDDSPAARAKLRTYGNRDTMFTLILTRYFYKQLQEIPRRLGSALIEARSLVPVAMSNLEGMLVDRLQARWMEQYLADVAARQLDALRPYGVVDHTVIRSTPKLAHLLYDVWGLPVLKENTGKKTGRVSRATDKEVLHELALMDPRAQGIREYRGALGNSTKFATTPLQSIEYNDDYRTHPESRVFGTYSGRMTVSSKQGKNKAARPTGFALHQAPNPMKGPYRDVIVPPEGFTLMEFDAAGQEFRWMAIASEDPTMLNLCEPGEDPHGFMGARIDQSDYRALLVQVKAGDKPAKGKRQMGKVANLSLQYRTSAPKLRVVARVQFDIPMEIGQARYVRKTYLDTYPLVQRYWDQQIALTKARGWVETYAGRRVQVTGNWSGDKEWSMGSTAINYRIQGTGADQKYLAIMCLRPLMDRLGASFAFDMHDGIYFWVPNLHVEEFAVKGKATLLTLPYKKFWGFTPPIILPWDCKHGPSWGQLKESTYV